MLELTLHGANKEHQTLTFTAKGHNYNLSGNDTTGFTLMRCSYDWTPLFPVNPADIGAIKLPKAVFEYWRTF